MAVCMAAGGVGCSIMSVTHMRESNKTWQRRLNVVLGMEQWMHANISRYVSSGGRIRSRTDDECRSKGAEYLYCNLLLGKTMSPVGWDPLFVDGYFPDKSLEIQLGTGADGTVVGGAAVVRPYWDELHRLQDAHDVVPSPHTNARFSSGRVILRSDVIRDYLPHSSAVRSKIFDLEAYLRRLHVGNAQHIDECIIGLVLRYRCVGGFASNQHGSISTQWGMMMPDMVECFASPLNHVFDKYYSIFDEDCVFGGMGNLFKSVGESFRSGRYEVNPPFEENILDRVSDIVMNTYNDANSQACLVMFAPNWKDSTFFLKLSSLVTRMGPDHAAIIEAYMIYGHVSGGRPVVSSFMFVFAGMGCSKADASAFIRDCKETLSRSRSIASDRGGSRAAAGPGFRSKFADTMERVVQILI